MDQALTGAVELLERSLGYTRVALADVRADLLERRTPCAGWSLRHLLGHMEDALDAFTEAAAGQVHIEPVPGDLGPVDALQAKACALLGAWSAPRPVDGPVVAVGDLGLAGPVLVATAALEITLHGWDVGQATGRGTPIPTDLAASLLAVARAVIGEEDRGPRFAGPRPVTGGAPADVQLLAWAGRSTPVRGGRTTGPPAPNHRVPTPHGGLAS